VALWLNSIAGSLKIKTAMQLNRDSQRTILLSALLAAATLAAFSPLFGNGFIKFDDGFYVVRNPHVAGGLTWNDLRWAFNTGYQGNWHPLTWVSHMLDVQLFGMRPGWHHLVSLLFHIANAVLLFVWLQRLTAATWRSLSVAALFALHPVHVESVAWVAERKDVLSTFFLLLTLLAYTAYTTYLGRTSSANPTPSTSPASTSSPKVALAELFSPQRRAYMLALVFFALGLMSKPMLVTLPFLLLLLDFWPLGRLQSNIPSGPLKALLREKIPFFALTSISSVVTLVAQQRGQATYLAVPFVDRLGNAVVSYWVYLAKTIWPLHLSIYYPHPWSGLVGAHPLPLAWVILAALGLAIISFGAFYYRLSAPWFTVGWFWFLGTLVPVIGIIQVGGQALADRYTYIPLIGIFLAVVWAASALVERRPAIKPVLAISTPIVLAICAVLTQRQAKFWHNDFTIFARALSVTPENALAHYHLGIAYRDQHLTAKALKEFQDTVAVDPHFALAYPEIGGILEDAGKGQEALELYEKSVKLNPRAGQLHNLLATRLWALGKQDEAFAQYEAALRSDPDYADAHFNFGVALASRGQFGDAVTQFAAACRLRPDDGEALGCLAEALMKQGRLSQAEDRFRQLTLLAPTNALAHYNLGLLLVERRSLDAALTQFQQAVAINSNYPDALVALAWLLATHPQIQFRQPVEAVKLAEHACELIGGKQSRFWSTLDVAYAGAGRFADAIKAASKAQELAVAEGQTNAAHAAALRIEDYKKRVASQ
jgi:tetratricopeptide (TPR) repeat protein